MSTNQNKFTPVMTVESTRYGFNLHNVRGELLAESEPANKGKLHRILSSLGYKPTTYAGQWLKRGATITTHSNEQGALYYSTTDENGKLVYSFSPKFDDIWTEDTDALTPAITMNLPLIQATIRWNDTGEILEDVLIKQTHDVGDDDEDIFFYGIPWEEIDAYLAPSTEDFTILAAALVS